MGSRVGQPAGLASGLKGGLGRTGGGGRERRRCLRRQAPARGGLQPVRLHC